MIDPASGVLPHRFAVLLFGSMEDDRRAQRMLEILSRFGTVFVIEAQAGNRSESSRVGLSVPTESISFPAHWGVIRKHIFFWYGVLRTVFKIRPSVVVAEDYFTVAIGRVAAALVGARLVYDAHELIIPPPGESLSARTRVWYGLERWGIRSASLVIAANSERASHMLEHYEFDGSLTYMRNITELSNHVASTGSADETRYDDRDENTNVIIYQGYISSERGLDNFIKAMAYLPSTVSLLIAGDGPDMSRCRDLAQTLDDPARVQFLGYVPPDELPSTIASADIGIVTYSYHGLNNIFCAPNKIHDYAYAGLPVVASSQPPLRRILEEYRIGELIPEEAGPPRIAKSLERVLENPTGYSAELRRFIQNNRWKDEVERVEVALERVLRHSQHS